jgi:hypothetical protein
MVEKFYVVACGLLKINSVSEEHVPSNFRVEE